MAKAWIRFEVEVVSEDGSVRHSKWPDIGDGKRFWETTEERAAEIRNEAQSWAHGFTGTPSVKQAETPAGGA